MLPPREQLEAVADLLRATIEQGAPTIVKELLDTLIDRVEVRPDRHAQPFFKLPSPAESEMPEPE